MFEVEVRNIAGEPAAVGKVDEIAEIPNSLHEGTAVTLGTTHIGG